MTTTPTGTDPANYEIRCRKVLVGYQATVWRVYRHSSLSSDLVARHWALNRDRAIERAKASRAERIGWAATRREEDERARAATGEVVDS